MQWSLSQLQNIKVSTPEASDALVQKIEVVAKRDLQMGNLYQNGGRETRPCSAVVYIPLSRDVLLDTWVSSQL
ncbi:MAG: hypothetical protein AAFQ63_21060 [Cyanobacteria bacterium J06621_11]